MDKEAIPKETIERLLFYTKCLSTFKQSGKEQFSSADIAQRLKLKPTLVRKDLSYIGCIGRRGVGYNIERVLNKINQIVYYEKECQVALIGVGNKGIKIGIIAVPPIHIKEVIDIVKDSEIKAILNFTPTCLMPYDDLKGKLKIKNIDLAIEMQRLVYYLS